MSKARKIYTEADWKAADVIDRLYMHLMEPERWELTYKEDEKLEVLRMVWGIMCKKSTNRERIKLISQHVETNEAAVMRYMKDAQLLFGEVLDIDVEVELKLSYDRMMKLYDKAFKDGDFETARRCQANAIEILEKIEARAPKKVRQYPTITFTSDAKALRARNDGGEYIDFDEHEPESVLEPQAVGVPAGD